MQKSPHHEHGWMLWPIDSSVEYQIDSDCLRVRRWENGVAKISDWSKWDVSTDASIRKHLRAMAWDGLPQHHKAPGEEASLDRGHYALSWLRDHLPRPFHH